MEDNLPIIYVSTLLVLLAGVAIFLFQQIFRTRRQENRFSKLQQKLEREPGTAEEYYELGSLFLDKKLFVQAVKILQRALKASEKEEIPSENIALIYNALGFAYFSQEQYDLAIRNYKEALKLYPEYVIAFNNLGNVYEKKKLVSPALEAYEEALKYDPKNKVAQRRVESLRKRVV